MALRFLIVLLSFGSCFFPLDLGASDQSIAVVVSEKNPIINLSLVELKKILMGQKHVWPNGTPVRVFVRAAGASERSALLKLLGMSESEYKQYWRAQVFRGDSPAEPLVLFSNAMQREAVLSFPGAVVLVNLRDVKDGEKIVRINGLMPGDPGYPIQ